MHDELGRCVAAASLWIGDLRSPGWTAGELEPAQRGTKDEKVKKMFSGKASEG